MSSENISRRGALYALGSVCLLPAPSSLADAVEQRQREICKRKKGVYEPSQGTIPELDEVLKAEYRHLFETCKVRAHRLSFVSREVKMISYPESVTRYKNVERRSGVPWYFVGILHGMEGKYEFSKHLHNGDPLKARTVNVPAGRPEIWDPPNDWETSALDALTWESSRKARNWGDPNDWSLERTLYRFELYNGMRTRVLHKLNSPYLWSFSNHYERGKFVADNCWDSSFVSQQCGAAVKLRGLVDAQLVTWN